MQNGCPAFPALVTRPVTCSRTNLGCRHRCALAIAFVFACSIAFTQSPTRTQIAEWKEETAASIVEASAQVRVFQKRGDDYQAALLEARGKLASQSARYRALVVRDLFLQLRDIDSPEQQANQAETFVREAVARREQVDQASTRQLTGAANETDIENADRRGRVEGRMRFARIEESAARQVLTEVSPTVALSGSYFGDQRDAVLGNRTVSRTVVELARLAGSIAEYHQAISETHNWTDTIFGPWVSYVGHGEFLLGMQSFIQGLPNTASQFYYESIEDEISDETFLALARRDMELAEYRRVALDGLIVDPETNQPVTGLIRVEVSSNAEKNLAEYLAHRSPDWGFLEDILWSTMRDLGEQFVEEGSRRPEYQMLRYLTLGEDPTPQFYFSLPPA